MICQPWAKPMDEFNTQSDKPFPCGCKCKYTKHQHNGCYCKFDCCVNKCVYHFHCHRLSPVLSLSSLIICSFFALCFSLRSLMPSVIMIIRPPSIHPTFMPKHTDSIICSIFVIVLPHFVKVTGSSYTTASRVNSYRLGKEIVILFGSKV